MKSERQISYGISYAWNLKYVMKQFIYNREKDTQIQKTNLRVSGERMLGREGLGVWSWQIQTIIYRVDRQQGHTV